MFSIIAIAVLEKDQIKKRAVKPMPERRFGSMLMTV
jgi:hypothetical protein